MEGGKQPFYSDDMKVIVVQNGEIFNHIELSKELKGQDMSAEQIQILR